MTATQTTQVVRKGSDAELANVDLSGDLRIAAGKTASTDTINERTSANGVSIDGLRIKDGVAITPDSIVNVSADGAITIPNGNTTYFMTKAGVAAMTIADPTAGGPGVGHDGVHLLFIATTAQANTLSNAAGSGFFSSGGSSKDVATWGGAIGDRFGIVAFGGKWYVDDTLNVTLG